MFHADWRRHTHRCARPQDSLVHVWCHAQIIPINEVEEALAAFRDDATLARATVVWKKGNGSARERLLLIRSCARLGRQDMVLGLLPHNLDTEVLCEDLFLDAVRSDKPTVSNAQSSLVLLRLFVSIRFNTRVLSEGRYEGRHSSSQFHCPHTVLGEKSIT